MSKRSHNQKYVLPALNDFQRKLEDFYQSVVSPRCKAQAEYEQYVALIVEYHNKGMNIREIARLTGMSHTTIINMLDKRGIPRKHNKKQTQKDNGHEEKSDIV